MKCTKLFKLMWSTEHDLASQWKSVLSNVNKSMVNVLKYEFHNLWLHPRDWQFIDLDSKFIHQSQSWQFANFVRTTVSVSNDAKKKNTPIKILIDHFRSVASSPLQKPGKESTFANSIYPVRFYFSKTVPTSDTDLCLHSFEAIGFGCGVLFFVCLSMFGRAGMDDRKHQL